MDSNNNFFSSLKHPLNYQTISTMIDKYPLEEGFVNSYKEEKTVENFDELILKVFSVWKEGILKVNISEVENKEEVEHLKRLVMGMPERYDLSAIKELYKDQTFYNNFKMFKKITNPEQIILKSNQISKPFSKEIETVHNLYFNLDNENALELCAKFMEESKNLNSDYILKINKNPVYENKLTIMSDDKNLTKNLEAIKNIVNSDDKIVQSLKRAPILSATVAGVMGYSQTSKENDFFPSRMKIIDEAVTSTTKNWMLKNIDLEIKTDSENIKIRDYLLVKATDILTKKTEGISERIIDKKTISTTIKKELSNKIEEFLNIDNVEYKNYGVRILENPVDLIFTNEDFKQIAQTLSKFLYKSNEDYKNTFKTNLHLETEAAGLNLEKFYIGEAESKTRDYIENFENKAKLNFPEMKNPKEVKEEKIEPKINQKTRLDELMEQYKVLIDLTFNMRNYKVANQLVNTLVEIERETIPPNMKKHKNLEIILKKNTIPYTYKIMTDIKIDERGDVSIFPRLKSVGELEAEKENLISSVLNSDHPYSAIEVTEVITMVSELFEVYTNKIKNNQVSIDNEQTERGGRLKWKKKI